MLPIAKEITVTIDELELLSPQDLKTLNNDEIIEEFLKHRKLMRSHNKCTRAAKKELVRRLEKAGGTIVTEKNKAMICPLLKEIPNANAFLEIFNLLSDQNLKNTVISKLTPGQINAIKKLGYDFEQMVDSSLMEVNGNSVLLVNEDEL